MCQLNWSQILAVVFFSLFLLVGAAVSTAMFLGAARVICFLAVLVAAIALAAGAGARFGGHTHYYN